MIPLETKKLAEQGDIQAQSELGRLYFFLKRYQEAKFWLQIAATGNQAEAQYFLGNMYVKGLAGDVNEHLGREWIEKAAQENNIDAMVDLSGFYKYGNLAYPIDRDKEKFWLEQAASLGDEMAQIDLAIIYREEGNFILGKKWFEEAISMHDSERAMYLLGNLYLHGVGKEGEGKNEELAFEWLKKSADKGNPNARGALNGHLEAKKFWQGEYSEAKDRAHSPSL